MGLGGWLAGVTTVGEWIQVDILSTAYIYRVDTQGRNYLNYRQWTKTYKLKYSLTSEESSFEYVTSSPGGSVMTFDGNYDADTVVGNEFPPHLTRFVRLYPQTWQGHIALRWEVYGCADG